MRALQDCTKLVIVRYVMDVVQKSSVVRQTRKESSNKCEVKRKYVII